MKPEAFASYAVVLGNFNTFGEDAPATKEWPAETRQAFLAHMAKGRGLVMVHAGSSVFYDWPEFHNLACGTWKDGTNGQSQQLKNANISVSLEDMQSPFDFSVDGTWKDKTLAIKLHLADFADALAGKDTAFKASVETPLLVLGYNGTASVKQGKAGVAYKSDGDLDVASDSLVALGKWLDRPAQTAQ